MMVAAALRASAGTLYHNGKIKATKKKKIKEVASTYPPGL